MVGIPLSKNLVDAFDIREGNLKPLWTIQDFTDEQAVLKWCTDSVDFCEKYYQPYFALQFQNLLIYQGNHWLAQDKYQARFLDNVRTIVNRKTPRLVFNHCYDFVEHHVSKATRYKPAVAIFPTSSDPEDKDNAKTSKDVLDHIWYVNSYDAHLQNWVRYCKIFGEAFMKVDYDFNKGDIHPDWLKLNTGGQRIPLMNDRNEPVLGQDGQQLYISKAVKTGEVKYSVKAPWHYFEQPCTNRDDIEWCIEWDCVDVDYLRAKYPNKADEIRSDGNLQMFNDVAFDYGRFGNEVIVYKLYHDKSEFLEGGRHIIFTRTCVLENVDLPFSHGKRPYVKIHDLDVPDCIRGMSFFQQIFPINHQINSCASLIYKMLVLLSHPKIAMPEGACEMTQLVNEATVLTHAPGMPPSLMHMNPPIGEPMQYMDMLTRIMEKLSGTFEMSRGQAPSGVRAAKALRALEEQEDKRSYGFITKFNNLGMVESAKMALSVAGDNYDDSDGRFARVLSKDNEFKIVKFKAANLSKPYDIRIENTTALSQSPSARIEELNEMAQIQFPPNSVVSKEQYINLVGLSASEEFKDIVTRAVKCAESENQDILSGATVAPPTEDEDLIVHWKVHLQPPQSRDFKENTPTERKQALQKHILLTEYLMYKKAFGIVDGMGQQLVAGNPLFMQKLQMECPTWPVYFKMPVPMAMGGMGAGAGMMPPPGPMPPAGPVPDPMDPGMPLDSGGPVSAPPLDEGM